MQTSESGDVIVPKNILVLQKFLGVDNLNLKFTINLTSMEFLLLLPENVKGKLDL